MDQKRGDLINSLPNFAVPNYFPPDSPVLRSLVVYTGTGAVITCENLFGRASMAPACNAHDACYANASMTKTSCDQKLLHDWEDKCNMQYKNVSLALDNPLRTACRESCKSFVKLMSEAQKFDEGGICPSCMAYNAARPSTGSGGGGTVVVRRSNGSGFAPNEDWTGGPYFGTRGTFFADVTGDGKADAIVVNDGTVTVRRSTGSGFAPNEDWTGGPYFGTRGTLFADVTGDDRADAIVVND